MRIIFILSLAAIIAGCASVNTIQADCESTTSTFKELASCVTDGVRKEPSLAGSDEGKLYLLKVEQLGGQVETGKISDLDARVELQQLAVQLKAIRAAAVQRAVSAIPQQPARAMTCTGSGQYVRCR